MNGKRSRGNLNCWCGWEERVGTDAAVSPVRFWGSKRTTQQAVGSKRYSTKSLLLLPGPCGATICELNHKRAHHIRAGQDPPTGILGREKQNVAGFSVSGRGRWEWSPSRPKRHGLASFRNAQHTREASMPTPPRRSSGTLSL